MNDGISMALKVMAGLYIILLDSICSLNNSTESNVLCYYFIVFLLIVTFSRMYQALVCLRCLCSVFQHAINLVVFSFKCFTVTMSVQFFNLRLKFESFHYSHLMRVVDIYIYNLGYIIPFRKFLCFSMLFSMLFFPQKNKYYI